MSPQEAAKRFARLQKMINKDLPKFIQGRIAQNAVAMISQRVIHQQRNFLGGSFSNYSRKPMLTSGVTEKSKRVGQAMAGSKQKRKALNWVTLRRQGRNIHLFELKGGYAQLRRLEGFSNAKKSFWFTSQMWRGFGVKKTGKTKNEVIVTLGGRTLESQKKIDANSRREGINIINISDNELKKLAKMVDKEIQRYVNKLRLA